MSGVAGLLAAPPWALAAMAVLLVAALYARVAGFEFVNLDDSVFIFDNKHVMTGLSWENIRWAFGLNELNYWQPLTWLSLMLDSSLYENWPGGFHLTNLALHCANVALVFGLVLRWTGLKWPAFAVALLFGLHPAHVESVAWVTERKDVLFMFFGLLALHSYTIYARKRAEGRGGLLDLWPALLAYAASLAAKPMLATLPALLLVLDFWPLGRFKRKDYAPNAPGLPVLLLEKLPFLLLAAAMALLALSSHPANYDSFNPGLGHRLAVGAAAYVDYLRLLVFPAGLAVFYPYPQSIPLAKLCAALLLVPGIAWAAWRQVLRRPYLLAGWLWFIGTLTPVLIPPKVGMHTPYADRWTYFPFLGLYLALALLVREGFARMADEALRKRVALAAAAILLAVLGAVSSLQLGWWRNAASLYERALAVTEDNYFIMNNYGVLRMHAGDGDAAEKWFRRSITVRPGFGKALGNLGILYMAQGEFALAMQFFASALQEDERLGGEADEDHYGMGFCLAQLGRYDEAKEHYQKALQLRPDYPQAYNDLGNIAQAQGQREQAIGYFEKALRLDPGYAVAQGNLARAKAAP